MARTAVSLPQPFLVMLLTCPVHRNFSNATSLPLLTVAGALLLFPSFYWEAGAAHPGGHRHQTW